jgi:hypothetical protein
MTGVIYEVDVAGECVTAQMVQRAYARHFAVQRADGTLLGYVVKTRLGRYLVYAGTTMPAVAERAVVLGTFFGLQAAIEALMREVS